MIDNQRLQATPKNRNRDCDHDGGGGSIAVFNDFFVIEGASLERFLTK